MGKSFALFLSLFPLGGVIKHSLPEMSPVAGFLVVAWVAAMLGMLLSDKLGVTERQNTKEQLEISFELM